ncbi:hypothetical protein SISSUDRAFT_1055950 [Sistotremastrum suecicum HHB10207 ss-3]|uniref:holo-[acyl-carrier-protein] synthase n=1 Tax=Sistotremastrum suecicum HHB10207 ss-3 TaxID=1314776 RepID=A0A165XF10_9AGAM|nr:hypothetical protein SISSUDRAFT_1055950 [Sistotremastrum suecicum HHB10207 ss-3]
MSICLVSLPFASSPESLSDALFDRALLLVDEASQAAIKRFYHREDAWRGLIGRLLPRALLNERGVELGAMSFDRTNAGKPFVTTPFYRDKLAFNVSHDHSAVIMAFDEDLTHGIPCVGVDIMKLELPRGQTLAQFTDMLEDQLSRNERDYLASSPEDPLHAIFLLWTLKEAYTKSLGLGLGFDFSRIDYDFQAKQIKIDGEVTKGWVFYVFTLNELDGSRYQCALVRGADSSKPSVMHHSGPGIRTLDVITLIDRLSQTIHIPSQVAQ